MNRARLVLQLLGRRGGAYIYRLGRRVVEGLLWSLGRGKHKISPHKKRKQKDTSIHDGTHGIDLEGKEKKSEERTEYVCLLFTCQLPEGQYKYVKKGSSLY